MSIINNFREKFFEKFDSAALVISEVNRFYLSGFQSSDGAVLVTSNRNYLLVDFRYYEMAKKSVFDFEVVLTKKSIIATAKEICENENVKSIVVEDDYITVSLDQRLKNVFDTFEISYFGDFITKMRSVKTDAEIEKIKNSQKLTDAAFSYILEFIRSGITENDVALELDHFMRKNGAQGSAFKTISVSGKKSSLPHGEPDNSVLTANSFLTMDFGAILDGYCSDMTRTVVIGRADEEMKRIYDIVLKAQLNALSFIKAGVLGSDVDKAARDIISNAGYGENFGHSTGHGLGLEVHESPSFSPNYNHPILENSVLSVEPGIYLEGKFGVRIEDIVVVKSKNAIILTESDKKLIEL